MAKFLLEVFAKVINQVIFGNKMTKKIYGELTVPAGIERMYELIVRGLFQNTHSTRSQEGFLASTK